MLGQFPDARPELLVSIEADVYPRNRPERSDLIDGSIGEGSPFQRSFGYFAHGVDASTSILPAGWERRLVLVAGENTRFVRGWCLEVHDLAIAKLVAGRLKDLDFIAHLIDAAYVDGATLRARLATTELDAPLRPIVEARLGRLLLNYPSSFHPER